MELTLSVRPKVAEALRSSGATEYVLEADFYVVLQALNWNIRERADAIIGEIEAPPSYSKIAELAGQLQTLAAACDEIERDELPAMHHSTEGGE